MYKHEKSKKRNCTEVKNAQSTQNFRNIELQIAKELTREHTLVSLNGTWRGYSV